MLRAKIIVSSLMICHAYYIIRLLQFAATENDINALAIPQRYVKTNEMRRCRRKAFISRAKPEFTYADLLQENSAAIAMPSINARWSSLIHRRSTLDHSVHNRMVRHVLRMTTHNRRDRAVPYGLVSNA